MRKIYVFLIVTILVLIFGYFYYNIYYIRENLNRDNLFTSADMYYGWYWGDNNQKKPNTPSNWILRDSGTRSARWCEPTKCDF